MIYVKEGQYLEEEILDNNEHSPLFDEFLQILGDKVRLKGISSSVIILSLSLFLSFFLEISMKLLRRRTKPASLLKGDDGTISRYPSHHFSPSGFDKYKGGLDTVHDLTGLHSVYTHWRGIEVMFHVSTMLPYEKNDPQKVYGCTATAMNKGFATHD